MLEDFESGQRLPAASIAELFAASRFGAGPSMAQYQTPPTPGASYSGYGVEDGSKEVTYSFVWSAVSWVTCWVVFPILGLYYANQAAARGNPSAQGAKIFAIVSLCLQGLVVLLYIIFVLMIVAGLASGTIQ
jgi:hypothetical protein